MRVKPFCKYCRVYGSGHTNLCKELYIFALQCEVKSIKMKLKQLKHLIDKENVNN